MMVTFIGNDGSGKSSLIKETASALREDGQKIKIVQEFDYFFLSLIKKALGSKKTKETQIKIQKKSPPNLTQRLLPYIVWLDLLIQFWWLKLLYPRTLIIRDRYAYDFWMTWEELGVSNSLVDFLYARFPKADICYYVKVKPETAAIRRGVNKNKDINFYKEKFNLYENFYSKSNFVWKVENEESIFKSTKNILYAYKLKKKLSKISLSISGIDGAGKSTIISMIEGNFRRLNIKYVKTHFYYNYIIIKLKNKVFKPKKTSQKERYKKSIKTEESVAKKNLLWVIFVLVDAYVQYLWTRLRGFNKTVLFDRFFYDYEVSFKFLKLGKWNKFIKIITPNLKNKFLLVGSPAVLHKRKPEHTLDFFEICSRDYKKIGEKYDLRVIDTVKNKPEEVLRIISQKI